MDDLAADWKAVKGKPLKGKRPPPTREEKLNPTVVGPRKTAWQHLDVDTDDETP